MQRSGRSQAEIAADTFAGLVLWTLLLFIIGGWAMRGCTGCSAQKPSCFEPLLAQIEADYELKAAQVLLRGECDAAPTVAECHAMQPLRAERARREAEARQCH